MGILSKIGDIIGGVFLLLTGMVLLSLYYVMRKMPDNWFIALLLFLFLIGLGLGGIILGARRIILSLRSNGKCNIEK